MPIYKKVVPVCPVGGLMHTEDILDTAKTQCLFNS